MNTPAQPPAPPATVRSATQGGASNVASTDQVMRAPITNRLLESLPVDVLERWQGQLEFVELPFGKVLYESGDKQESVYFPTTAIVSLLVILENGAATEIAVAGNEGLVGISLFMGGKSTPSQAVVQSRGNALKLKSSVVMAEFHKGGPVTHLLLRYTQALITQMAVCIRCHSVQQQVCRWLLLSLDRLEGNQLVMTHELIAGMLGVRREGVTEVARLLKRDGIIDYQRGHITVLDRPRLEALSCECYAVVKHEYDRLLPECDRRKGVEAMRNVNSAPHPIA